MDSSTELKKGLNQIRFPDLAGTPRGEIMEKCDKCGKEAELQTHNVVNVDTEFIVAIIELCPECVEKMDKEGRITRD